MMVVIGIDPGLRELGWAVIKAEFLKNKAEADRKERKKKTYSGVREKGVLKGRRKKSGLEGIRVELLDFGVIATENGEKISSVEERIKKIGAELKKVFRKWKPDLCGIESPFVWKDPSAALKLGMVVGTGIEIARQSSSDVVLLAPIFIKSKITGNQFSDKDEVRRKVERILVQKYFEEARKKEKGSSSKSKSISKADEKYREKVKQIKSVPHHITDAISTALSTLIKKLQSE